MAVMPWLVGNAPEPVAGVAGDSLLVERLLGAGDEILRPCILWNDGRSAAECADQVGLYLQADAADVMGFYVRDDLPFAYGVADEFTICDRYFSPVGAPTLPNRHYLHCASAYGLKDKVTREQIDEALPLLASEPEVERLRARLEPLRGQKLEMPRTR